MRLLGIDGSLNTGIVDLTIDKDGSYGINHRGVISSPVKKGMARFSRYSDIATKMMDHIGDTEYDGIFIEGYSYGSKTQGITMGEIGAVLRFFLWQEDKYLIIEVPPTNLKKFVTGNGNAPKDLMMMSVFKRWKFEPRNNDEADAFGLAMFGASWLGVDLKLPSKCMEALDKLKKDLGKN